MIYERHNLKEAENQLKQAEKLSVQREKENGEVDDLKQKTGRIFKLLLFKENKAPILKMKQNCTG